MSAINNPQLLSALSSLSLAKARQAGHKDEHEAYLTTLKSRQQVSVDELRSIIKGGQQGSDKKSETSEYVDGDTKRSASPASSSTPGRQVWKDTMIVNESGLHLQEPAAEPAATTLPSAEDPKKEKSDEEHEPDLDDDSNGPVSGTVHSLATQSASSTTIAPTASIPAISLHRPAASSLPDQVYDRARSSHKEILEKMFAKCASAKSYMEEFFGDIEAMDAAGDTTLLLDWLVRLEDKADEFLTAVTRAREEIKELSKW